MKYHFYDTCSLLLRASHLWDEDTTLVISSVTLDELENIKTSPNKDPETKFAAKKITTQLSQKPEKYRQVIYYRGMKSMIDFYDFELTNDARIIACAAEFAKKLQPGDALTFVTNDLCCKALAQVMLDGLHVEISSYEEDAYDYDGYKEVYLDSNEMAEYYSNPKVHRWDLLTNQYALIFEKETGNCVDKVCWTGAEMRPVGYNTFDSDWFGRVKPIKGDPYQTLAMDSLTHNKITMIKGPAGSGKSYLSLAFLLNRLEHGRIDKIIVFCNTVAAKNAARLGFYPGDRDTKLLDSQIGSFLASKLGGNEAVLEMIEAGKLMLIPLADARGFDTSGMNAGIYITEAQNMDIELMKLTLQRIGEDSICIIDGDFGAQVDMIEYSGSSNGMRRASAVFRGEDVYGEVTLKNIHRSRIATVAERM